MRTRERRHRTEFKDGSPVFEEISPRFRETFVLDDANVIGRYLDEVIAAYDRKDAARELTQQMKNGDVGENQSRGRQ